MAGLSAFGDRIMAIAENALAERAAEAGISVEDQRALEQQQAERHAAEEARREAERQLQRAEARAERDAKRQQLGEDLGLGVACHIGHIVKLSGLSASSAGNGWDRATVWHLVVDAPLASGRLRRSPGDLLCRNRGTLGARTMGISGRGDWDDDCARDPDPEAIPITCRACLERLLRFQGVPNSEHQEG